MNLAELNTWNNFFKFFHALNTLKGIREMNFPWARKGSEEEDAMFVEAGELVLDNIANADNVNLIDAITGKNLRDQLTVEEIENIRRENELRKFRNRN